MKQLYNHLARQTTVCQKISCVDSEISFLSSEQTLIDLFTGPLKYILPEAGDDITHSVNCIVESTTAVDNWPKALEKNVLEISPIDNITVGEASLITTDCGMTLVLDSLGSIYHSGDGHLLCLIKPAEEELKREEFIDVQSLAIVLVSEVLLLSEKLLVHAGCVGRDGDCQIWTGDSGAGKTTRVLNLINKGYQFYGEDQIIVGKNSLGGWRVWPFWRHIKATRETSKLFPTEQDLTIRPPDDRNKYSFDNIEEVLNVSKPPSGRLASIIKLIPGEQNILAELDFSEAFQQISPGFMHALLPDSTTRVMDITLDIISDVPTYLVSWDMLDTFDDR